MPTLKRRSGGFTLVEIAIVVVIVGLLIGGLLKGQELIMQARGKNLLNDFSGAAAAVLAYRDRYQQWPGDDNIANTRWAAFGALAGNGNGMVEGSYNDMAPTSGPLTVDPATGAGESLNFWWHLRVSGFVFGPTSGAGAASAPVTAAGGILGVQTGSGIPTLFPGLMACASDVADRVAVLVDAQLDDASPQGGQVRSVIQNVGGTSPTLNGSQTTNSANYTETGARWVVCRQL